jgi:hypothetical protein
MDSIGSLSGIRCLFDPWIRDLGWVQNQDPDPGMNNPGHISDATLVYKTEKIKISTEIYAERKDCTCSDAVIGAAPPHPWRSLGSPGHSQPPKIKKMNKNKRNLRAPFYT